MKASMFADETQRGRPNVLHILSDQHSPLVAGCYGDQVVATPHLDRLALSGVIFDAAYCPSPICVPSRASMLTGRYPVQNRCWNNSHILDSGIPTFAHSLGAAGYRTCIVGRMHSLGPDQLRGYQERHVGDHSPNFEGAPSPTRGLLDGTAGPSRVSLSNSGPGQGGYQVHDEEVTAVAVDWLAREGIARRACPPGSKASPFLLTVGYMLPHQPFVARREEYERYRGRVPGPSTPAVPETDHPYLAWWRARTGIEAVTPAEVERARTAYWALVDRMDAMIGQVMRALEETGLADDTLVVYTTDHGEQAGEHGLWWKQTFHEASVRVPLIMSWPGVIPGGGRCPRVVSALDVTATIIDAAGAPALPVSPGRSLLGIVGADSACVPAPSMPRPEADAWEDVAFSEFCVEEGWYQRMIRSGPWKLIVHHHHRPQLFNIHDDPAELHDRAADPACRRILADLQARVRDGWDPDAITEEIAGRRSGEALLRQWARVANPPEQYRWLITTAMHWLDAEDGAGQA